MDPLHPHAASEASPTGPRLDEAWRDQLHRLALQREQAGELSTYPFYGHRPLAGRPIGPWVLSQWYPHPFTLNGVTYPTAEHAMMAAKARLFNDQAALAGILEADTPADAKGWGRKVAGYTDTAWHRYRWSVVRRISYAKFTSTPELTDFLCRTHGRLLVEAAPSDRIWGIGLRKDHPNVARPTRWPGLNLLGYALTDVRSDILAHQ